MPNIPNPEYGKKKRSYSLFKDPSEDDIVWFAHDLGCSNMVGQIHATSAEMIDSNGIRVLVDRAFDHLEQRVISRRRHLSLKDTLLHGLHKAMKLFVEFLTRSVGDYVIAEDKMH